MTVKQGLKGWKLDAGQKGHRILFKDYHKGIVDILLEDPLKAWGSGAMWQELKTRGITISRASVIFYLNFLVDDGLVEWDDATGKGGHHKLYRMPIDWEGFKDHVVGKLIKGLGEALDETPLQIITRLT